MKRTLWSLTVLTLFACSPSDRTEELEEPGAVSTEEAEEAEESAGEAVRNGVTAEDLSHWKLRLDDPVEDPAGFRMTLEDGGLDVITGPAGIAWRPVDLVLGGDFTVSATFTQVEARSEQREGFGLVVGGRNLEAPDQAYTYFLVRSTGEYLVKRRTGDETSTLVDWKSAGAQPPSDAQEGRDAGPSDAAGGEPASYDLAVRVQGEEVHFQVNGRTVETLPRSEVEPYGLAGIRVNHRLHVGVRDFSLRGERVGQRGLEGAPGEQQRARPEGAEGSGDTTPPRPGGG